MGFGVCDGVKRKVGGSTCCCSVLRCVAVCCSVLQCVAVYCIVLQCIAACCSVLQRVFRVWDLGSERGLNENARWVDQRKEGLGLVFRVCGLWGGPT